MYCIYIYLLCAGPVRHGLNKGYDLQGFGTTCRYFIKQRFNHNFLQTLVQNIYIISSIFYQKHSSFWAAGTNIWCFTNRFFFNISQFFGCSNRQIWCAKYMVCPNKQYCLLKILLFFMRYVKPLVFFPILPFPLRAVQFFFCFSLIDFQTSAWAVHTSLQSHGTGILWKLQKKHVYQYRQYLKNPAIVKNIQEEKLHLHFVLSSNDDSDDNYDN